MSLLTLAIWVTIILAVMGGGFALLPDGSSFPFPPEIGTSIIQIYQWLYSFNALFPVDTLIRVLAYGVSVVLITRYALPLILWIIKTIRGNN